MACAAERRAPSSPFRYPRPCSAALVLTAMFIVALPGCQSARRPIFPAAAPPVVWPPPPDAPRIQYVGELRGEADLDVQPTGWDAFRAMFTGPEPTGAFSRPCAVAVSGELIFVADAGLGVVHMLDLDGRRYATMHGAPDDPLRLPIDVDVIEDDKLAVVDRTRAAVDLFDLDGVWIKTLRWPEIKAPTAVAWDAANHVLWIADVESHACYATRDLIEISAECGARGADAGQFNYPTGLAMNSRAELIVADAMNFRVQAFDHAGAVRLCIGQKGDGAGDFARPRDVAVDAAGRIYVLDNQFENVQIFDDQGRLLMAFGRGGDGSGEFSIPAGITIDAQDRIWIADSYNQRVQVFQLLTEAAS